MVQLATSKLQLAFGAGGAEATQLWFFAGCVKLQFVQQITNAFKQ